MKKVIVLIYAVVILFGLLYFKVVSVSQLSDGIKSVSKFVASTTTEIATEVKKAQ